MAEKSLVAAADARLIRLCDRVIEILLYLTFLLVPVFFIILTRDQFELPKLTVLRILTVGMLAAWAVRTVAARRFDVRRTPLDLPIWIWVGLLLVTTFFSVSRPVSWLGEYENFRGLLTSLNYVVLYYLGVTFIRTRAQIDRLLFVIVAAGLLTTAYGIAQFVGVDFIAWNPASVATGRYFSTMGNPNFLAAYLAMVMPLLVIFFLETQSRFRRLLLFITFISMFFCLMGTWSRGGFLGLLVGLAGVAGFGAHSAYLHFKQKADRDHQVLGASVLGQAGRQRFWLALVTATLLILIAISATFGHNHMVRVADSVLHISQAVRHSRLHIWGPALKIFASHPLLGTGLDTFKTVFPAYATAEFAAIDGANVASRTAHNELLQVLATQGVVGLLVVGWLTVLILRNWWLAYTRARQRGRDRLILVGLLGSWLAYTVQNAFSFGVVSIDSFYWLLLVCIVLLQDSAEEQARRAPLQTPEPKPRGAWAAPDLVRNLAVLVILFAAGAGVWQAYKLPLADYAYNLASVYRLQGRYDAALREFARAARLVPAEVKYVVYEGLAYEEKVKSAADPIEQQRFLGEALRAYQTSVRMSPTNAYYLGNLGRAYSLATHVETDPTRREELYGEAVKYYKQAIAQGPVTVLFYQNLAFLYLASGDEAGFRQVLEQIAGFDKAEAAKVAYAAANTLYGQARYDAAEADYRQALAWNPAFVEAHYNLGVVLAQKFGPAQGETEWRRALELKPDFEPARQMLLRNQLRLNARGQAGGILP